MPDRFIFLDTSHEVLLSIYINFFITKKLKNIYFMIIILILNMIIILYKLINV